MKRFILTIAFCLVCVPVFAGPYLSTTHITSADSVSFQTANTSSIYTDAILSRIENPTDNIGIMYKGTGSTVDLKIELQQSFRSPSSKAKQGVADTNYVVTDTVDSSITTSGKWFIATIDTVVMPYIRFKVTGQGSNAEAVYTEIKVSK